jgi:hypothetical protein
LQIGYGLVVELTFNKQVVLGLSPNTSLNKNHMR